MMIELPYGRKSLIFNIESKDNVTIKPPEKSLFMVNDIEKIIGRAIKNPLINNQIEKDFDKKSIGIAINDHTRPLPYQLFLKPLIYLLEKNYGHPKKIDLFIAAGTHKPPSDIEIRAFIPEEIINNYPIACHDCDKTENLVFLGFTSQKTPVYVNKCFFYSDIKIVIGNIEPHHFMGYSGGVKTAAIGLAGRETISKNHSFLSHPKAKMGLFKSNPMRMDVEEIGSMMGIDYAFNIILDNKKNILASYWGDPFSVIECGIKFFIQNLQVNLDDHFHKYDLVIASPGGYPKDINLYQAQKALTHACFFAKPHSPIILTAECREGFGNQTFKEFLEIFRSPSEVINAFEKMTFVIGPHKA